MEVTLGLVQYIAMFQVKTASRFLFNTCAQGVKDTMPQGTKQLAYSGELLTSHRVNMVM